MQPPWTGFWTTLRVGQRRSPSEHDLPTATPRRTAGHFANTSPAKDSPRQRLARRILVPTDFSPASSSALDRAVALANQCHATLTILHVVDINTQSGSGTSQEIMGALWKEASVQMAHLAAALSGQANAQTVLQEGLPWERILAESRHYDLIVLGKGGPKRRWQLFSKHTVERVLEESACPVMVVRNLGAEENIIHRAMSASLQSAAD